ncbi:MAG: hypothetical protein DMG90_22005, partial [Acidobacteria bacterium]
TVLCRDEAERIAKERKNRPMCLVDIAVPRDIDPAVRQVEGMFLFDIDDLEQAVRHNAVGREAAAAEAEKIIVVEANGFRRKLMAERVVPTIVALRGRLDDICRQELEYFCEEFGPFSKDQEQMFEAVTSRITKRIAGSLARELKELPERVEGGAGADDRSCTAPIPSRNAGNGACRHQFIDAAGEALTCGEAEGSAICVHRLQIPRRCPLQE